MAYNPQNRNGQATKANSTPVVLASDQNNALETGGNLDTVASYTNRAPTAVAISTLQTSLNTISTNIGNSGTSLQTTLNNMNTSINTLNINMPAPSSTSSPAPGSARTIGAKGVSSDPANTTSGFTTIPITDLAGKLITMPYAINQNFVSGVASATDTTSTSVIANSAAGIKIYITGIVIVNTGNTTANVNIQNGSGGTTLLVGIAPAGNGQTIALPVPIPTSAATGVYFASGTNSSTIYVTVTGYKGT